MQQMPDISEARKALLQKYLRGEVTQLSAGMNKTSQTPLTRAKQHDERMVCIQTGTKTPFFFLHGDWTGNAFFCFKLARQLGPEQPFYVLDTYRFTQPELPALETIAAEQLRLIREVQPEGPYLLGGFCNGGLIAYEMARQLHRAGQRVDLLVLMDTIPARCRRIRQVISRLGSLLHWSEERQLNVFLRLQHVYRYFLDKNVEDYQHIKQFDARIDSYTPPVETLRREFPAMFIWATALYQPSFYPGKVTLFWDEAEPDRRDWWHAMAAGRDAQVDVHIIPGSHKSCRTDQIGEMSRHLKQCLDLREQNEHVSGW